MDEASLTKLLYFPAMQISVERQQRGQYWVHDSATTTRVPVSITARKLLGQALTACCSVDRIIMIVLVKVMLDKC